MVKTRLLLTVLLIAITLSFILASEKASVKELGELKITVTLTHRFQDSSEIVVISGRVMSEDEGISDTLISLQVNDPHGGSVHITLIYSNETGHFKDEFTLETEAVPGNYTLYLTASKMGFKDSILEIPFLLYTDFDLMVSPAFLELRPGELGNFTVEAVPEYPGKISIRLLTCPKFIECHFIPSEFLTGGNTTLFLNVSVSAPPGKYNITIAGIANGKIQNANLTVSILKVETTTTEATLSETNGSEFSFLRALFPNVNYFYIIIGAILTGSAVSTFMILKIRRRRKEVDLSYMSAARAIAKLEELKALGKIDTETYERLKREYESKI